MDENAKQQAVWERLMTKVHSVMMEESLKLHQALSPSDLASVLPQTEKRDAQVEKILECSKNIIKVCKDICNSLLLMNSKEAERHNIPENEIGTKKQIFLLRTKKEIEAISKEIVSGVLKCVKELRNYANSVEANSGAIDEFLESYSLNSKAVKDGMVSLVNYFGRTPEKIFLEPDELIMPQGAQHALSEDPQHAQQQHPQQHPQQQPQQPHGSLVAAMRSGVDPFAKGERKINVMRDSVDLKKQKQEREKQKEKEEQQGKQDNKKKEEEQKMQRLRDMQRDLELRKQKALEKEKELHLHLKEREAKVHAAAAATAVTPAAVASPRPVHRGGANSPREAQQQPQQQQPQQPQQPQQLQQPPPRPQRPEERILPPILVSEPSADQQQLFCGECGAPLELVEGMTGCDVCGTPLEGYQDADEGQQEGISDDESEYYNSDAIPAANNEASSPVDNFLSSSPTASPTATPTNTPRQDNTATAATAKPTTTTPTTTSPATASITMGPNFAGSRITTRQKAECSVCGTQMGSISQKFCGVCGVCFIDATSISGANTLRHSEWKKRVYTQNNFLPSTPEEIADYKKMMKEKYEAQQREAEERAKQRHQQQQKPQQHPQHPQQAQQALTPQPYRPPPSPRTALGEEQERLSKFISNPPPVPTPPYAPASPAGERRGLLTLRVQRPKDREQQAHLPEEVEWPAEEQQEGVDGDGVVVESEGVVEGEGVEGEGTGGIERGGVVIESVPRDPKVEQLLTELQLERYIGVICDQEEITYDALLLITNEDLIHMGIPTGPRKILTAVITELSKGGRS